MNPLPHQSTTKNAKNTGTENRVQPITINDSVKITDAFVDFNIKYSNPPNLVVMTNRKIKREFAYPVSAKESTETMIGETEEGLFFGWQNSPAQPPANTSPTTKTEPVTHETAGVIDRVPMFDHEVKGEQNKREPYSVLSVTYKHEYPSSTPTRVEFAHKIISRYINGPLGTSTVSYWAHRNGPQNLDEKYKPYLKCNVGLVKEPIYTWIPKRVTDISATDTRFDQ